MPRPIKLRGRFATVFETAETLGVSPLRTRQLIALARKSSENGSLHKMGSPATVLKSKKGSRRHAAIKKKVNHS
ncbi:MAG: hypothetical protein JST79_19225 [Acidobacteria bacterium]|jgi:hypothetical protein|nr:hypothetical protein [Acidobacteriota bacterium]